MRSSRSRLSGHDVSMFPWEPKVALIYWGNVAVLAGGPPRGARTLTSTEGAERLSPRLHLVPYFNQRYQKWRSPSAKHGSRGNVVVSDGARWRREVGNLANVILTISLGYSEKPYFILGWGGGVAFNNKRWDINIPSPASFQELFHTLINGGTLCLLTAAGAKIKFPLDFNQFFWRLCLLILSTLCWCKISDWRHTECVLELLWTSGTRIRTLD